MNQKFPLEDSLALEIRIWTILCYSKLFRLPVKLHDATRPFRPQTGVKAIYWYRIGREPNSCSFRDWTIILSLRKIPFALHFDFCWFLKSMSFFALDIGLADRQSNKEPGVLIDDKMVESDFKQIIRLMNQIVVEAGNINREHDWSAIQNTAMFGNLGEQLKLCHNVFDLVDRVKRTIFESNAVQWGRARDLPCRRNAGGKTTTDCLY